MQRGVAEGSALPERARLVFDWLFSLVRFLRNPNNRIVLLRLADLLSSEAQTAETTTEAESRCGEDHRRDAHQEPPSRAEQRAALAVRGHCGHRVTQPDRSSNEWSHLSMVHLIWRSAPTSLAACRWCEGA
jgi:hypothetical protein